MNLEIAVQHFLQDLRNKNKSMGTVNEYQKDLNMFLSYLQKEGVNQVKEVKGSHMASYLENLIKVRNYKPSSRNRQMNTLRSFFKFCKKAGIVDVNYAEYLERLEEGKVDRVFLTSEEVKTLIQAIEHPLIKLVIITLFFTGSRISECLNLELGDIDFEQKILLIRKGKGNKSRTLPLHPDLESALKDYINRWRVDCNTNKLFLTERSGKLSDVYVNRVLKETVKKLKWDKKITCHVLRHSFASALVQRSVHIVAVKELLGHASLKTTSGYAHIQRESVEEAIQRLAL
ncbi:tyrosine-type recombinase/integrase [Neobacillus sp. MER 74]|uniref:tyrosine-type recombinase/integrase n=1 Tax=Neobacillus sp. MER 74 TaxID=2939566 RepID=UPI0020404140|nr:tyrosine-type recombinase/integrase [Neobacillus sp. MER 74]MCM3116311.1 tyrosine-type recombinase/integrase [Neobacillus sp. MER 74]